MIACVSVHLRYTTAVQPIYSHTFLTQALKHLSQLFSVLMQVNNIIQMFLTLATKICCLVSETWQIHRVPQRT